MNRLLEKLLPSPADNRLRGSKLPYYVFLVIAVVSLVRSCIHLFAPDGGARSIAGMNLAVAGASEVIFSFALWGSAQLIYAILQLVVVFRYRSLIPFMFVVQILESLLRVLVARMKPVTFSQTPPGAWSNFLVPPLCLAMLLLSLSTENKHSKAESALSA